MYENKIRIKSPIFYMGNKFDLLENLLPRFPLEQEVGTFIDLFGGSGTVSLNVPYTNIIYNELNDNIINLLEMFINTSAEKIIQDIENNVNKFGLPKQNNDVSSLHYDEEYKNMYNEKYLNFREYYNKSEPRKMVDLYTLTFFSFSNLIRFNSKSEFNMPFGNRYFTKEHQRLIYDACKRLRTKNITISNKNAFEVLKNIGENKQNYFIYLDPPYLNTQAIYNENRAFGGWSIEDDYKLFGELDRLNALGIKWAMSNVLENKGKKNEHLEKWAKDNGYIIIHFEDKQYSSLGKGNANSKEVLIVNYNPPFEEYNIFDFMEE